MLAHSLPKLVRIEFAHLERFVWMPRCPFQCCGLPLVVLDLQPRTAVQLLD